MKIDEKLVTKIENMRQEGLSDEKIGSYLDLERTPDAVLQQFEDQKAFIPVEEIATWFQKEFGKQDKENHYYLKVLRLLKGGQIKGTKPSNKEGWKVKKEAVQSYIEESKMSKDDWKKLAKTREQELKEKDELIAKLQEKIDGKPPTEEEKTPENGSYRSEIEAFIKEKELEVVPERKEKLISQLEKEGYTQNPKGKYKNPLNKRRTHDTKEDAIAEALK